MNYRFLQNVSVSEICFGTATFARGKLFPNKNSEEGTNTLLQALNEGINIIHSNPNLETQWAIKESISQSKKKPVHIIKIEAPLIQDEKIIEAIFENRINQSLNSLQTDELFGILYEPDHKITPKSDLENTTTLNYNFHTIDKIFLKLEKKYKINFIGLMAKTEIELNTAIENEHFKVVSSYFNLYNTWPAKYFDKLKSKKLDFIAIQPLKYGILTDGFASTKKPFDKYASLIYYSSENAFKNIFAWQKNNYSEPLQTTALKFALAHESVKTVIIGISSANHLIENLNIEPLNKLDFYNIINTELK
ncbi:MAG: aldo/keto reductase [Candidatus Woesearchaeota archaeon]|jgi:aryl-alcohol dehydrogenase-like predicted oxidoreductase